MIPSPWVGLILALGVARLVRLAGYDDLPPIVRLRAWAVGESISHGEYVQGNNYVYKRPTLKHWLSCAYCVGAHLSLAAYLAWLWQPEWTLYALAPFALSMATGIIIRRYDP